MKETNTCSATGCNVSTKMFLCGSHYRLLFKEDRDRLKQSNYSGQACIDAIELIAEREGKEINMIEHLKLKERYEQRS